MAESPIPDPEFSQSFADPSPTHPPENRSPIPDEERLAKALSDLLTEMDRLVVTQGRQGGKTSLHTAYMRARDVLAETGWAE